MKVPVIKRSEYIIYFEDYNGSTFTHADVGKWNKTVKEDFINSHKALYQVHGEPFYALVDNVKLTKFVVLLGYKPHQSITCTDGVTRHVWIYNGDK